MELFFIRCSAVGENFGEKTRILAGLGVFRAQKGLHLRE
jgi:hypothetical protein